MTLISIGNMAPAFDVKTATKEQIRVGGICIVIAIEC